MRLKRIPAGQIAICFDNHTDKLAVIYLKKKIFTYVGPKGHIMKICFESLLEEYPELDFYTNGVKVDVFCCDKNKVTKI